MREIHVDDIRDAVAQMCIDAAYSLSDDVRTALERAAEEGSGTAAHETLALLQEKAEGAGEERTPICRDSGIAEFFVEVGQDLRIKNGFLLDAINEGVRKGYRQGRLRMAVVDPLTRKNTGDNTPATIYTDLVPGDRLRISLLPQDAEAEGRAAVRMLAPTDGVEGIREFVLAAVRNALAAPCPPMVIGVGVGGDFAQAALLARRALVRPVGSPNPKLELASLEESLLRAVNRLEAGTGGGSITAMAVHVESFPCHAESLPVGVNISCHAMRHRTILL